MQGTNIPSDDLSLTVIHTKHFLQWAMTKQGMKRTRARTQKLETRRRLKGQLDQVCSLINSNQDHQDKEQTTLQANEHPWVLVY